MFTFISLYFWKAAQEIQGERGVKLGSPEGGEGETRREARLIPYLRFHSWQACQPVRMCPLAFAWAPACHRVFPAPQLQTRASLHSMCPNQRRSVTLAQLHRRECTRPSAALSPRAYVQRCSAAHRVVEYLLRGFNICPLREILRASSKGGRSTGCWLPAHGEAVAVVCGTRPRPDLGRRSKRSMKNKLELPPGVRGFGKACLPDVSNLVADRQKESQGAHATDRSSGATGLGKVTSVTSAPGPRRLV